jgi:hypothetical protein
MLVTITHHRHQPHRGYRPSLPGGENHEMISAKPHPAVAGPA